MVAQAVAEAHGHPDAQAYFVTGDYCGEKLAGLFPIRLSQCRRDSDRARMQRGFEVQVIEFKAVHRSAVGHGCRIDTAFFAVTHQGCDFAGAECQRRFSCDASPGLLRTEERAAKAVKQVAFRVRPCGGGDVFTFQ